jgi:phosphoribosylamine--glycine ligase
MTGGMGAYTMQNQLLPFIDQQQREQSLSIIEKLLNGIQEETKTRYHGFLYGQFMLEKRGAVIVETNVRLGDPEAINVMALLKSDPVEVFMGIACSLPELVEFESQASVCKYLVPQGYPDTVDLNLRVKINESVLKAANTQMIYAGVEKEGDFYKPMGSRFSAISAVRPTIAEAESAVETTIDNLKLSGIRHRRDIATEAQLNKKIERMWHLLKG